MSLVKAVILRYAILAAPFAMYGAVRAMTPEIQGNTVVQYSGFERIEYTKDCDGDVLVIINPFLGDSRTTDNDRNGVPDEYKNGLGRYKRGDSAAGTRFEDSIDKQWKRYRTELKVDEKLREPNCN